ncbi:hypothetical protein, partial [Serratia bockelmannii]|uniref:hypothetical protein n=1 Tax=Serratia bockelmannii TaxID=2703793 RepID=UPI003675E406
TARRARIKDARNPLSPTTIRKTCFLKQVFFRLQFMRMSTSFATTGFALWRASICRPREIYLSFTLN